jgi:hypothetical protein
MDVVYVTGPYWNRASKSGIPGGPTVQQVRDDQGGDVYDEENLAKNGFPTMEELLNVYEKKAGWNPRGDRWDVARVFHLMRVSLRNEGLDPVHRLDQRVRMQTTAQANTCPGKRDKPRHPSPNHQWPGQQLLLPRIL